MNISQNTIMPGDILFYASTKDIADIAIQTWTNSKYVHVAIAVSSLLKIESTFAGVVKTPIVPDDIAAVYILRDDTRSPLDRLSLSNAMLWLESQVGQPYGWGDIANALLTKFEKGVSIDIGDHYDCSDLAASFLIRAGNTLASSIKDVHNCTPADLASVLAPLFINPRA